MNATPLRSYAPSVCPDCKSVGTIVDLGQCCAIARLAGKPIEPQADLFSKLNADFSKVFK